MIKVDINTKLHMRGANNILEALVKGREHLVNSKMILHCPFPPKNCPDERG